MNELLSNVEKTLRYHGRHALRTARSIRWRLFPVDITRPIFVVGCSRAGTTLVYRTISESSEVGSLQRETHDFWMGLHPLKEREWQSHAVSRGHATALDRRIVSKYFYSQTGMRRFVDKNNQNGLCIDYLHELFPDARFVYVQRSPGDNIHSLIEGWGKAEEFATWSADLPAEVRIESGQYKRWCFFLFEGWREYLERTIEDVCAAQYIAMNRAILHASRAIPPSQWTTIQYEDLVRDPVAGFRRVFESIDIAFTPALERHCSGVLSTPYNAFSEIRLDKWRTQANRYRIERVIPLVAPLAKEMGYRA